MEGKNNSRPRQTAVALLRCVLGPNRRKNWPPGVKKRQGALALQPVALPLVAYLLAQSLFQRQQQIKGYICRLELPGIGMGNVVHQRAQGGAARHRGGWFTMGKLGGIQAGEHSGSNGFGVAFHAGKLPGNQNARVVSKSQGLGKHPGSVDVGIPMDLPVAKELCPLQARYQPKDPSLLAEFKVVLQADQVVGISAEVLAAQLHHRPGYFAGAWIAQADRLHGAKAERVPAAPGYFFNRQAALEVFQL